MTFAQFMRLKPKYKVRIIGVLVALFALLIGCVVAISAGVRAIQGHLNTVKLDGFTAMNILQRAGQEKVLEALKLDDGKSLLIMDSEIICGENGAIQELKINMANLIDRKGADYWQLTANAERAVLRRTSSENQNRQSLTARKMSFQNYYPALPRVTDPLLFEFLRTRFPAGEGGLYTFTDHFDNNQNPQYSTYLADGMVGVWVPQNGNISVDLPETFIIIPPCVPFYVTVEAVDEERSRGKRVVLKDAQPASIVFLAGS